MKNLLFFGLGGLAGSLATLFISNIYLKKKYILKAEEMIKENQKEVDSLREYYEDLISTIPYFDESDTIIIDKEEQKNDFTESEEKISYNKYYNDNVNDEQDDDQNEEELNNANEYHETHKSNEPIIIRYDEFNDLPEHFDNQILFYYQDRDILTDDSNNVIDDPEILIGDALDAYDFRSNEEDIMWVKNDELDVAYEVQKVFE